MSQPEQQTITPDYSKVAGVMVGNQWLPIVAGSLSFDAQGAGGWDWQAIDREHGFTVLFRDAQVQALRYVRG